MGVILDVGIISVEYTELCVNVCMHMQARYIQLLHVFVCVCVHHACQLRRKLLAQSTVEKKCLIDRAIY